MLDQNTDRMWYVIGAIVIGAAIIAAALFLFDNAIMSNIGTFMDSLTKGAGKAVGKIQGVTEPEIIGPKAGTIIPMLRSLPLF